MPRQKKDSKQKEVILSRGSNSSFSIVKDLKDVLPNERVYWSTIEGVYRSLVETYGFSLIDTTLCEYQSLYSSMEDDYSVVALTGVSKSKDQVVLRPHIRPSIVRAVSIHNLVEDGAVTKLSYSGQVFRSNLERSQSVLQRFGELGFEVLGDRSSAIDAYLISLAVTFLKKLGLDCVVAINSIGDEGCRALYREALSDYFKQYKSKLDEGQKKSLRKDPISLLNAKSKKQKDLIEEAPQIVDYLSQECKDHFFSVLEYLDDLDISYNLDPVLVHNASFYNRTVYEIYPIKDGEPSYSPYGMGGRYDYASSLMGGKAFAGSGFHFLVENIIAELKNLKTIPEQESIPEVFIAQIGEQARRRAMVLFQEFLSAGISVREAFVRHSLKSQLEVAQKLKIPYILILGQKEVADGTILFKDLESGAQELLDLKKAISFIEKLKKQNLS